MGRSPSGSSLTSSPPPPSSAPSRRSGRVPKPTPNPEQLLASPTAAKFPAPKPMEQPSTSTASAKPRLKGYDLDYKDREKGKKRATSDNPTPWRHPDEFPFVNRADWPQDLLMEYMRYHSFSVPPRDTLSSNQLIPILLWGSLPPTTDPTSETFSPVVWLPRGYRVPLMFIAKFQWDSLRIVLNAPDPKADWEAFKFNILHLSRLCQHLFEQAREARRKALLAVDISQDKAVLKALSKGEKDRAVLGGFDKNWRCPSFDRLLTRFYNKWFLSTDEWLENFFNEFDEEEYHEHDVVKHDWIRWALKGHKGFMLTKDEVQNGITAEEYMWGLTKVSEGGGQGRSKWIWDDARKPPQNAVSGWSVPGATEDPLSVQVKREIVEHAMSRDFDHVKKSKIELVTPILPLFAEITHPPILFTTPPPRAVLLVPAAQLQLNPPSTKTPANAATEPGPSASRSAAQGITTTANQPQSAATNGQSGSKRRLVQLQKPKPKFSVKERSASASGAASASGSAPIKEKHKENKNREEGSAASNGNGKQAEGSGNVKRKRKRAEVEGEAGSVSDAGRSKRKRQSPVFKLPELPNIRIPREFWSLDRQRAEESASRSNSKSNSNSNSNLNSNANSDESNSEDSGSESEPESEEEDDVRKDKSYRPQWGGLRNKQIPGAVTPSSSSMLTPKDRRMAVVIGIRKEKEKEGKEGEKEGKGKEEREKGREKEKHKEKEKESSRASTAVSSTASLSRSPNLNPPPATNGSAPSKLQSQSIGKKLAEKKAASSSSGSPSKSNSHSLGLHNGNGNGNGNGTFEKVYPPQPYPGVVDIASAFAAAMNPLADASSNSQNAAPSAPGAGATPPKATMTTAQRPFRFRFTPSSASDASPAGVPEASALASASAEGIGHNSDAEMNEIEATMNAGEYGGADSPSSFDIASSAPSEDNEPTIRQPVIVPATAKSDEKAVAGGVTEKAVVDEKMEVDDVGPGTGAVSGRPSQQTVSRANAGPRQPASAPASASASTSASASGSAPPPPAQPESVGLLMSQGNRAKSLHTILLLRDLLQFLRVPGWGNLREVFERRGRGLVPGTAIQAQTQTQTQGQGQGQTQSSLLDDEEVMTVDQRLDILAHASVAMAQVLFPFRGEELSNKIDSLDHRLQQQFDLLWKPEDRPPIRSAESLRKAFEDKEVQTVLMEALSKEIQTMELEKERAPTPEPVPPRSLASQETQTAEPVEVTETGVQTEVDSVERLPSVSGRPRSNSGDAIMVDTTASSPVAGPSTGEAPKASMSTTEAPTPTAKAMMSIMRNIANLLEVDDGAAVTKSVEGKERETTSADVGGMTTDIGSSSVVVEAIVNEFKAMKEELREIQQKTHHEFESLTTIHRSEVESLKNELRSRDDRGKDELELIQQQHREELENLRETIRTMVREKEEKKTETEEENRIPALQLLELRQRIASLENRTRADASETMTNSVVGSPSVSQFSDHRPSGTFHPLGHLLSQDFEDVVTTPSVVASPASRHFVRENSTPNPGTPISAGNPSRHEEEESTGNASIPFPIKSQRKMHIMMFPRTSVG